jgi:hypothetical protein
MNFSSSSSSVSDSEAQPALCQRPTSVAFSVRRAWGADFLSPKDLVKRAVLIALLYGVVWAGGLKEYTSVLSNTTGSVEAGFWLSAFLGLAYISLYLAFVLLVPIFLLAAAMLSGWKRLR